jgi:hypothetical protein
MKFYKLSREVISEGLTEGYVYAYLNVYPMPEGDEYESDERSDYFMIHAELNAEFVPTIYADGDAVDSLVDDNYFGEFEFVVKIGTHTKMSLAIVEEYEDAQWRINRDAEHHARGTANATAGIFRPSY